jgi:CoA:oxalate CoA-transferase
VPLKPEGFVGVLDGLLVVDFTQAIAGPLATRVLGEMGARVIKIESPRGDLVRGIQSRPGQAWGPMFGHGSAGKESLCVDMRQPEGKQIVDKLLDKADIIVENFRPGVMESWGFAPHDLLERPKKPVVCSVSGFGRGTEQSSWSATDPLGQAFSGMTFMIGEPGGEPYLAANGIADSATAMSAVAGILAAVIGRMKDGRGRYVDMAMADVMLAMDCVANPVAAAFEDVQWHALGHDHPAVCPFGVFRALDGDVVIQGLGEGPDSTWGRLCLAIGHETLITDPATASAAARLQNRASVNRPVADWIAKRTRADVVRLLQAAGTLCGPVHSPREAVTHPFHRARGTVARVATDEPGAPDRDMVAMPFRPSGLSGPPQRPPRLGEHTRALLQGVLAMAAGDIDLLYSRGVIHTRGDWP